MLLLREEGLHSCPQAAWSLYPRTVGAFLRLPPQRALFMGMAIGYVDSGRPVNRIVSERAPLAEVIEFQGV